MLADPVNFSPHMFFRKLMIFFKLNFSSYSNCANINEHQNIQ